MVSSTIVLIRIKNAIALSTGPRIIFGGLKKNYFDYSNISSTITYVTKSGESPFAFDDINDDAKFKLSWEQQIFGPLLFTYEATMPLENLTKIMEN